MSKRKKMTDAEYSIAENVAALGINFGHHKKYADVSNELGDRSSPSGQFYQVAIEAALALEQVVEDNDIVWADNAEWPLTIDALAEAIMSYGLKQAAFPSYQELVQMATEAIDWN